jgi:wyosine [tRNA(Phe)-imidazoG37] synthetase (radical SAM superfamily)
MKESHCRRLVFGPVASRRLGRSLGIDLLPPKTCSYNCIYCQLGRTTFKTIAREEYVPTDEVIRHVCAQLAEIERPDYITFSGSGEPTLHASLGEIVQAVKATTDIPVAILTNGSLLWDPQVRHECAQADLVLPSLDAGEDWMFRFVNRPHPDLTFSQVVEGLIAFRREFKRPIWLEVFLLGGITALPREMRKIEPWIERIKPDRVQINTAVRPTAEEFAFPASVRQLTEFAQMLGNTAEVIADPPALPGMATRAATHCADIVALLARRPSSIEDIAAGLSAHPSEVTECIATLLANNAIRIVRKAGRTFFSPVGGP